MLVFVNVGGAVFEVDAAPEETVGSLKQRAVAGGFLGRAVFAGRELSDGATLAECGIQKDSTVFFVPNAAAAAESFSAASAPPMPMPMPPMPPPPEYTSQSFPQPQAMPAPYLQPQPVAVATVTMAPQPQGSSNNGRGHPVLVAVTLTFGALCILSLPGILISVIMNSLDGSGNVFAIVFPAVFGGGICLLCGVGCCVFGCRVKRHGKIR